MNEASEDPSANGAPDRQPGLTPTEDGFFANNRNEMLAFLLLQPVTAFLGHRLYIAATQGRIYGGGKGRPGHWIVFDTSPISFWVNVALNSFVLMLVTVVPVAIFTLAWRTRRRKDPPTRPTRPPAR